MWLARGGHGGGRDGGERGNALAGIRKNGVGRGGWRHGSVPAVELVAGVNGRSGEGVEERYLIDPVVRSASGEIFST